MDPGSIFLTILLARCACWLAVWASAERRRAQPLTPSWSPAQLAACSRAIVVHGTAWLARFAAETTDRRAAAAAADELYRLSARSAPIPVWVRSMRELAIVRPLIAAFLDGLGRGQSPADAWAEAVAGSQPPEADAAWTAAVARSRAQVRSHLGPDERRPCSSVQADLLAPLERDSAVLAVREHLARVWSASHLVARARVTANQLGREGYEEAHAHGLSLGNDQDLMHLVALEHLRATTERHVPADWAAAERLLRACAGAVALEGAILLLEHPTAEHRDHRGLLHATDGPALTWADGFAAWALDGHGVPREAVEDPDGLTVALIRAEAHGSLERHRLLVRTHGAERYVAEAAATPDLIAAELDPVLARAMVARFGEGPYAAAAGRLIHSDTDGLGEVRRLWACSRRDDTPLLVVEVANSTPEADGTRTRHWLRVPPWTATCQEAVAWTFGVRGEEYRPLVET